MRNRQPSTSTERGWPAGPGDHDRRRPASTARVGRSAGDAARPAGRRCRRARSRLRGRPRRACALRGGFGSGRRPARGGRGRPCRRTDGPSRPRSARAASPHSGPSYSCSIRKGRPSAPSWSGSAVSPAHDLTVGPFALARLRFLDTAHPWRAASRCRPRDRPLAIANDAMPSSPRSSSAMVTAPMPLAARKTRDPRRPSARGTCRRARPAG